MFEATSSVKSNKQCHCHTNNKKKWTVYSIIIFHETIRELSQGNQVNPIAKRTGFFKERRIQTVLHWGAEQRREMVAIFV